MTTKSLRMMGPGITGLIALLATLSVAVAILLDRAGVAIALPAMLLFALCLRFPRQAHLVLLFLIPLSMEVHLASGLGTDLPDESVMWMLCLPVLATVIRSDDSASVTIRHHILFRLLLVQWLWACTTLFFSAYPLLSLKYVLAKAWYILPFAGGAALYLTTRRRLKWAAVVLMTAMVIASAWVMARQALLGFSFEKVNDAVRPLFRNHVNYSALLVCLLPVAVAGAVTSVRYRKVFIAISAFWLVAVFLTYSRGAWLAVPAGLVTALALRYRAIKWMAALSILIIAASILYLASDNRYLDHHPDFNRTIYHADLAGHIEATYRLRDLSTAERFHRWIGGLRMMDGHWLQGHGPNSFYPEYKPYVVSMFRTWVSANREHSTVHNYFLLLLTEQGIPGLLFFVVLLGFMFHAASKMYHGSKDPFTRTLALTLSAMLGMIITLIALSDLIETDKIGGLFYTIAGILACWSVRGERSATGFDVERIAQSIAQQVEREYQHHDGEAR